MTHTHTHTHKLVKFTHRAIHKQKTSMPFLFSQRSFKREGRWSETDPRQLPVVTVPIWQRIMGYGVFPKMGHNPKCRTKISREEEMNYVQYIKLNCCGLWPLSRPALAFHTKGLNSVTYKYPLMLACEHTALKHRSFCWILVTFA